MATAKLESATVSNDLKGHTGKLLLDINSGILDLLKIYSRGTALSQSEIKKENDLKKKTRDLEKNIEALVDQKIPGSEKIIKSSRTTVDTANSIFSDHYSKLSESELIQIQKEVKLILDNGIDYDKDLSSDLENELNYLDNHIKDRYLKIKKNIEKKITDQKQKLENAWTEEKDTLDYIALKELRMEFDDIDKKLRFLINEFDKRKYSDILVADLEETHEKFFDSYYQSYSDKADQKRKEAAEQRKKERDLLEYKNEKRRPIPVWTESVPYSKFKPDLISWNLEHHLTSSSSKFGLFTEMLKKENRITTFEQVQTRLGRNRNDENIIEQIVELLDTINEETCYNKLSQAWEDIISCSRKPNESYNSFFFKI